jgi:hypothetical protein
MLRVRKGQSMSWMIIAVVVIALAIAVIVVIYTRTMGAMNAMATLTGSGATGPGDSLTLTVTVSGGTVKIVGIVLLNSNGVVTTIGTTPGYSGSFYQTCRLSGVYINGASGPLNPPWVLQNGQSASFIFTAQSSSPIKIIASPKFRMVERQGNPPPSNPPSTSSDCASVSQAIIFYNSGKTAIIPIIG